MVFSRRPSASWVGRRIVGTVLALAGAAFLVVGSAEARVGSAKNFGSRGSKTQTAPPTTSTAPKTAQPVQRTATQAGAQAAKPGFMSRFGGLGGILAGGLIGAALVSMLGLGGGLAGMLGMILQVAVVGGLVYLAVQFFRRRSGAQSGPTVATASAMPTLAARNSLAQPPYQTAPAGGFGGPVSTAPLALGEIDFNAFEKMLAEVQDAFGRQDTTTLRSLTTSEMLGYLDEELAENAQKGVRNEVSGAKLLQGDLSESWTEGDSDYATVAMRYTILDATVDVKSGKIVSGSRTQPDEATELWTFVRPRNASVNAWKLSAIQQS